MISKYLAESFAQQPIEYEVDLNESFIGSVKGAAAGTGAAIIQMAGGALTFINGAPITGTVIFASSILTGTLVGRLVKVGYEMGTVRKLDAELAQNVAKRDELLSAYTSATALGFADPKQYQSKVAQLTKEQQKIGDKLMKHLMSSKMTLEQHIPNEVMDKLFTIADLAKKGSITSVQEAAKYRVSL
jgi:hypothetical protein